LVPGPGVEPGQP